MNRIHRLQRSAITCGVVIVALLLLTVPASRSFIAGQPTFMVTLLALLVLFGAAGMGFMWMADKVEARLTR